MNDYTHYTVRDWDKPKYTFIKGLIDKIYDSCKTVCLYSGELPPHAKPITDMPLELVGKIAVLQAAGRGELFDVGENIRGDVFSIYE